MGSVLRYPTDDGSETRRVLMMQAAQAATARSSIDLLSLPFPFSQVPLLDAEGFVKEAVQRRVKMWGGSDLCVDGLEELHRCGLLIPLFCMRPGKGDATRQLDTRSSQTPQHVRSSFVRELYKAAEEGRLGDPAQEPFEPWPKDRVQVERRYLYSAHQILGLDRMREFVATLQPAVRSGGSQEWFIDVEDLPDDETKVALASWRSLAITLSAIETRTWPDIISVVQHDWDVWRSAVEAEDPAAVLEWLGLSEEQLRDQSIDLRSWAGFTDDLGDFYDVLRRANPGRWSTLKGPLRSAMDARIAAQALDNFTRELSSAALPPQAPLPFAMRPLSERETPLDAVLTRFRLSPHPSVVIALEGQTEMLVVPKVLRFFGIPTDTHWVRLVNSGGVRANLKLLARYAAEPLLGADFGTAVMLDRPITRFLVFTDAEGKYRTEAERAAQRQELLGEITENIPQNLQRDFYDPDSAIVEIVTWGSEPFEFANFTDDELANALEEVAGRLYRPGRAALLARIRAERDGSSPRNVPRSPNIECVWRRPGVTKTMLAEHMWPVLEAKMLRALENGTAWPPVFTTVGRARELVFRDYGVNMSLRRYPLPGP